ncbi:Histone methylation protein [Phytophthora megakarya]|uniref:Histone methylation protein n=1 Tax=Phytophthora megakarya TaxID=4795 RepID=A0A225UGZ5_9STRA|nr:Histone methylation protein [Phytophthora megakarya]
MRTSLSDEEDKLLLVQIAYQFEREGLRITWEYVARRINRTRTPSVFRLQLKSLKRTYGNKLANSPRGFSPAKTTYELSAVTQEYRQPMDTVVVGLQHQQARGRGGRGGAGAADGRGDGEQATPAALAPAREMGPSLFDGEMEILVI